MDEPKEQTPPSSTPKEPKRTLTIAPPKPEKNPKRVAQGKKLSELSRLAKLARKKSEESPEPKSESDLPSLVQVSTVVGIGVGMATLFQMFKNYGAREEVELGDQGEKKNINDETQREELKSPSPPPVPKRKSKPPPKELDSEL